MPKRANGRELSPIVQINNVYDVAYKHNSYSVRFRDETSSDGWATANLQRSYKTHASPREDNKHLSMITMNESDMVSIERQMGSDKEISSVSAREFKALYNASRKLVKAYKSAGNSAVGYPEVKSDSVKSDSLPYRAEPFTCDEYTDAECLPFL